MGNAASKVLNDFHEPYSPIAREHRRPSITWEETVPLPDSNAPQPTCTVNYRARDGELYATREEAHKANEVYYISHPEAKSPEPSQGGIHRAGTNATMKSVKTVYNEPMPEDAIDDDEPEMQSEAKSKEL
jgi:hypothetical protein